MGVECKRPDFAIEMSCRKDGSRIIAGIDEAGRGALAGPLFVGLVVFPESLIVSLPPDIQSIRDSKCLSAKKRNTILEIIHRHASICVCYSIEPAIVDRINVNQATLLAIEQLVDGLAVKPDVILLDGNFRFCTDLPLISIIGGDSLSLSIAAASIVAKVNRDDYMIRYAGKYPHFGFDRNKGYGTADHRAALLQHGPTPEHRLSYEPARSHYAGAKSC